jgi:hypothetical protein
MRAGGGKHKGSAFEREIARTLSLWWTKGERDDIFARTMSSGAWGTGRAKLGRRTANQYGDLQAIDPIGQPLIDICCFELKIGYGNWSFLDMLDRPAKTNTTIQEFLSQAMKSGELARRHPVVIAKRDRRVPIIIMPKKLSVFLSAASPSNLLIFYTKDVGVWYVWRLSQFLRLVPPEMFFINRRLIRVVRRTR